jgi:hypothetical protein
MLIFRSGEAAFASSSPKETTTAVNASIGKMVFVRIVDPFVWVDDLDGIRSEFQAQLYSSLRSVLS